MRLIARWSVIIFISAAILMKANGGAIAATFTSFVLDGVTFTDGGTAQGTFQYDPISQTFGNVNITTSSTISFVGQHYSTGQQGVEGINLSNWLSFFADGSTGEILALGIISGSFSIATNNSLLLGPGESQEYYCCSGSGQPLRLASSGSIDPVPLPGTVPLFATGLGLIGLLGLRSQRSRRAAA